MVLKKTCTKCHREKSVDKFSRNRSKSMGYSDWCKECESNARYERHAWKRCPKCFLMFKRERGSRQLKCPLCLELSKKEKKESSALRKYCILCDKEIQEEDLVELPTCSKQVINSLRVERFNLDARYSPSGTNEAKYPRFHSQCLQLLSEGQRRRLEFKDFRYRATWIPKEDAPQIYEDGIKKGVKFDYQDPRLYRLAWFKLNEEGKETGEIIEDVCM